MKKIPKPQRTRRGKKYIGNWWVKDPATGAQINLGTKNAVEAEKRAKEFATTGKRNFQDDLDGAAEATVAAVETATAAPPSLAAPPVPASAETPLVASAAPPSPLPTIAPPPQQQHPPAAPLEGPPAGALPVNADWRDDAQAAASEAADEADADESTANADVAAMSEEEMDGLYRTAADLAVEGQLWAQAWIAKRRTGESPPPFDKLAEMVKQRNPKMGELITGQRDRGVSMWTKQLKIWVPLDFLPLYGGALISVASLLPLQVAAAASISAAKKRAGKAPTARQPEAEQPIPDAHIVGENGASAEAL